MFIANVLTLFPEIYPGVLGSSLLGNALKKQIWELNIINIRNFSISHGKVDDYPFGGGSGMILKADVLDKAILSLQNKSLPKYYLSPRGKKFDNYFAKKLSKQKGVTLICGRYEGIDERVIEHHNLIEISIGDYILSGGDLAAMVVLDSTVRLIPNVINNANALIPRKALAPAVQVGDSVEVFPFYTEFS